MRIPIIQLSAAMFQDSGKLEGVSRIHVLNMSKLLAQDECPGETVETVFEELGYELFVEECIWL